MRGVGGCINGCASGGGVATHLRRSLADEELSQPAGSKVTSMPTTCPGCTTAMRGLTEKAPTTRGFSGTLASGTPSGSKTRLCGTAAWLAAGAAGSFPLPLAALAGLLAAAPLPPEAWLWAVGSFGSHLTPALVSRCRYWGDRMAARDAGGTPRAKAKLTR